MSFRGKALSGNMNNSFRGKGSMLAEATSAWKANWKGAKKVGDGSYARGAGPYEGDWSGDVRHGSGKQMWDCGPLIGCIYEGEWKHGQTSGEGKFTHLDGSTFSGKWIQGQLQGKGVIGLTDGSHFRGEFQNGRPNGHCTWTKALETFEGLYIGGKPESGEIHMREGGYPTELDDSSVATWTFKMAFDISEAEKRQLTRPNPVLNPEEWRNNKVKDMSNLPHKQLVRIAELYGVNLGVSEDGDLAAPIPQVLTSLAMAMWERLPSAELIFQARKILSETELNPMMEQSKMEESFEDFMESVIDEDDAMADEGSLQLFADSASQARESIANPQNPEVLGYRILGRVAFLDPVLGAEAGLLLDLTSAPFRPGDQAYCAYNDTTAANTVTLKRPNALGPPRALRGSHIKMPPPAKKGSSPSYLHVERYTGHALMPSIGPELPPVKGCPKVVPPYTSHDFSMNSHVATFEGEDMSAATERAQMLNQSWREARQAMSRTSSGVTTSPLESPHRSSLVSSPALRGGAGTGSTKLGSLDAGGPSPSMESLRLTQSIKSNYQVGVYETFKSVEQENCIAADREGLILPSIKSPNTESIRDTPNMGSIREYKSGFQQATSPLQGTAKYRRAGRAKGGVEVPSGLFDGYLESTPYDFSNLGELIYLQKGLRPLVKWNSLNDQLNNVLKARYTPEGGGAAITAPPYTQGPATLPPQRLKVIDTADQLVFTLGLREGNRILKSVRKLDVSGHQIPSIPDHIGHIAHLTSLNFSHNRLQGLPNSFIILTHLTQLNLSSNQGFSKIVPHQIYRLVRLEDLNLSHCGIQTVAAEVSKLARLRTFNISHNSVHSLPLTALEGMTNLVDLEVQGNPLQEAHRICGLPIEAVQEHGSTLFIPLPKETADGSSSQIPASIPQASAPRTAPRGAKQQNVEGYWAPVGALGYIRHRLKVLLHSGEWVDEMEPKTPPGEEIFTLRELIRMSRFLRPEYFRFSLGPGLGHSVTGDTLASKFQIPLGSLAGAGGESDLDQGGASESGASGEESSASRPETAADPGPEEQGSKQEPIREEEDVARPSSKKSSKKGGKKGKKDGKKDAGPPKPPLYKVVDLEDRLRRLYRLLEAKYNTNSQQKQKIGETPSIPGHSSLASIGPNASSSRATSPDQEKDEWHDSHGILVNDVIAALNDSGLVRVKLEKFVKLVEKHKVDTHVADLASADPAPLPEGTATESVPPPVVVNPEPPSTAGSNKKKKGKKGVKVDSMFDFWGGGGKLRLHESTFMSIMFDALQGMQAHGHMNGEEEKKGKKGKKKK